MTAEQIAEAFNTASPRGQWRAFNSEAGGISQVHFEDHKAMVAFKYIINTGEFQVVFRKAVGSFGDYANSIARGLTTILSALQAAGLPFVAHKSPEGVQIIIKHNGIGNQVSCRYVDNSLL